MVLIYFKESQMFNWNQPPVIVVCYTFIIKLKIFIEYIFKLLTDSMHQLVVVKFLILRIVETNFWG